MIGAGGGTHFVDSLGTTVEELGKANEKVVADMGNAEEDIPRNIQFPKSSIENSYAIDIGKFKAGMD
jgi:hypothetical protein